MRPPRGLWHPAILVMQPTENRRRDYSTSRGEVMAGGDQPVSCGVLPYLSTTRQVAQEGAC